MVENQKLFRVSKLDDQPINKELENKLLNHILDNTKSKRNCF